MTALLMLGSLAFARDKDSDRKLETRISLDLRDAKLSDAIEVFRSVTGLNFVVQEGGDTKVTLKLLDISARSALRLLLQPRDMTATIEEGAVVVRYRRCTLGGYSTRLYDVRGATAALRDFPGREFEADFSCFAMPVPEEPRALVEEDVLAMLIRSHTGDGQSWSGTQGTLSIRNGILVVRQTSEVHRDIQELLRKLGL